MENKKKFVEELGKILMMYLREKVKEFVEITYTNRSVKYVNITGDSYVSILRDIYYAIFDYRKRF